MTTAPEPEAETPPARRARRTTAAPAPSAAASSVPIPATSRAAEPASSSTIPLALVDRLAFLHEFAQLATHARDWDELMRTVVDRTTVAMGVEVCSFYLLDRDGQNLSLAATNGLDTSQVGRVSLAIGQGITGRAAAQREPGPVAATSPSTSGSRGSAASTWQGCGRCCRCRWCGTSRSSGCSTSRPPQARDFGAEEIEFLATIAALLAGIVEKGRMQAEAEAQLDRLSQLDAARAELLAVVTHELRTPLAVVRAYVDLLADAAASNAAGPAVDAVENWRAGATDQVTRLDRLVDSILASVKGEGLTGLRREPFDVVYAIDKTVGTLALLLRTRAVRWAPPTHPLVARGDEVRFRQVLEHLLDNEAKYAPPEQAVSIGAWRTADEIQVYITDDGPGVPIEDWEAVFQPYVRVDRARSRGSGIGLFAARRLMEAMGGRVWIERNGYGGSRFMVALPCA